MARQKRTNRVKEILLKYIHNNVKEFCIVTIVLFIGIVLGIIWVNNMNEEQQTDTITYITDFIEQLQQNNTIDKTKLLRQSVTSNLITVVILWLAGCTVIGMPIVYGIAVYRGFCLGYTISAVFASLEFKSALLFIVTTLLLQNILWIPALLAHCVSGIKSYQSIMKDRAKSNIKMEIYRHIIFSCMIAIIFVASSFIETYGSTNLFMMIVPHI